MNEIKVGSIVKLLLWRDEKVHDFTVTDIYFERYISDYKTIVTAKYYSEKAGCWFSETFFSNDFIKAMKEGADIQEVACNTCKHLAGCPKSAACQECRGFSNYEGTVRNETDN